MFDLDQINAQDAAAFADDAPKPLAATPFVWTDPAKLPPRQWLYGRHLIRKQMSVTVAPGGLGKSSLTIAEAIAMVSGRDLLGDKPSKPLRVWILNLEDPQDELQRRVTAAVLHHSADRADVEARLFLDSGRERGLCMAVQGREGAYIVRPDLDILQAEISARCIDVLIIDPFVSTHQVNENDNGAIDLVAKEWAKLAGRCNCAIELVHHTRKANGETQSSESARGAVALLGAARSARVLNRMTDGERERAGISAEDQCTYFAVTRDKANLAPAGKRVWRRMESVELGNGESVGACEAWHWPDDFDGFSRADLLRVQQALDSKEARFSDQAGDEWAGVIIADTLGLCAQNDRKRIKRMIGEWLATGALKKGQKMSDNRRPFPTLEVGEWATE